MSRIPLVLMVLLTIRTKWTESTYPVGYYVQSPHYSYFLAPKRAINNTDAYHIFAGDIHNCTCENVCFVELGCQAWSVSKLVNGSVECRVSVVEQTTAHLEEMPDSTYFFFEGSICTMSSMSLESKPFIYPEEMMEDFAVGKPYYISSENPKYPAVNANDGNDTTTFVSMVSTSPYWTVDLGAKRTIFHIQVLPTKANAIRFSDVKLYISDTHLIPGDFSTHTLLHSYAGPYDASQGWLLYTCTGIRGRYVSLRVIGSSKAVQMHTFKVLGIKENQAASYQVKAIG